MSSSTPRPFKHQPLDRKREEIRLFQLEYAQAGIPKCHVEAFGLFQCPAFTAVSYAWGPPRPKRTILLNGGTFAVRESIYSFMETLLDTQMALDPGATPYSTSPSHLKHGNRYLWCDQICIDQSDLEERSHQVGLMSRIYSAADHTVIWLGSNGRRSLPDDMRLQIDGERRSFESLSDHRFDKPGRSSKNQSANHKLSGPKWLDLQRLLLAAGTREAYWNRLWIVQEIWFSKSLRIMYGCFILPWAALEEFVNSATGHQSGRYLEAAPKAKTVPSVPSIVQDLVKEKQQFDVENQRLSYVLETFGVQQCSDIRDKVFGLLGLVSQSKQVAVDYGMTLELLFQATVTKIIGDESFLDFESHLHTALVLRSMLQISEVEFTDEEVSDFVLLERSRDAM